MSTLAADFISPVVTKWLQEHQASYLCPYHPEKVALQINSEEKLELFSRSLQKIYSVFSSAQVSAWDIILGMRRMNFSQSGPIPGARNEVVFS